MNNLGMYINETIEKFTHNFFKKTKFGKIIVVFPSGNMVVYEGAEKGFTADIRLNNFSLIYKILKKGPVGLAESYIDGDFTTSNLYNLLFFCKDNENIYLNKLNTKWTYRLISKFKHYLNQNTKINSKKNISYHYDLGNKFYKLWLDDSMTYSSGLFDSSVKDLTNAQLNKFKGIIESLELNDNSSLLEIGCGWGGFSTYVAKNFSTKIKAITISKEQYEFALKKISKEGLNEKINVELRDYRDINEKYDKIVSIEMFEAVGKKYWPVFFDKINNSLKNNGTISMQIITINNSLADYYQKNPDFIQQYIFPGGVLPSKAQLHDLTSTLGLKIKEYKSFGISYAKTLRLWNEKFQKSWIQIADQGFTLRFKRMWEYYLAYCEVGFRSNATDVSQFIIKK